MEKNKLVIYSDASFSSQKQVMGYCAFLEVNNLVKKIKGANQFKNNSSTTAEIVAISKAIAYYKKRLNYPINKIVIITDSLGAINIIEKEQKGDLPTDHPCKTHAACIKNFARNFGCEIEKVHVKAHSKMKDKKALMNSICDEIAKKQLYKYIERKKTIE